MPCQVQREFIHHKRSASEIDNEPGYFGTELPFIIPSPGNLRSLSGCMKRMKICDNDNPTSHLKTFSLISSHRSDCGLYDCNPDDEFSSFNLEGAPQNRDLLTNIESLSSSSSSSSDPLPVNATHIFGLDDIGNNDLHTSINRRDANVALNLIRQVPSFDYLSMENGEGNTALHLAALTNQPDLARALICAGAAVDAVDANSKTALHLACELGHAEVVKRLLRPVDYEETLENKYVIPFQRIPQNMELTDADGKTCFELAMEKHKFIVLRLLLDSGALPSDIINRISELDSFSDQYSDDGDSDESDEEEVSRERMPFSGGYGPSDSEEERRIDIASSIKHDGYPSDADLYSNIRKK